MVRSRAVAPRKVLVDCDPALFTVGLDVDDDLALLLLFGSPEVEVAGVTTLFGNSLGALTHRDARTLLARAGRASLPLARGAARRGEVDTPAARLLAERAAAAPGELTLLSLGPLTNVAAAARIEPRLGTLLAEHVFMGGRAADGLSDFNFRRDPDAAQRVLALPGRRTAIPFDLGFQAVVTPADAARLGSAPALRGYARRLARFARFQDRFRALRGRAPGERTGGFHPWDVLAAAWLVAPALFSEVEEAAIGVDARGRTRFLPSGAEGGAVRLPRRVDGDAVVALLVERVTRSRPDGVSRAARG